MNLSRSSVIWHRIFIWAMESTPCVIPQSAGDLSLWFWLIEIQLIALMAFPDMKIKITSVHWFPILWQWTSHQFVISSASAPAVLSVIQMIAVKPVPSCSITKVYELSKPQGYLTRSTWMNVGGFLVRPVMPYLSRFYDNNICELRYALISF